MFEQACAIFGQKFEYADFWANLGVLFGGISAKSGVWMKCSHRSHDVRTMFARLIFSRFSVRTDVRRFRACSHDVRTQAVGQRVCARFERNLHKSQEIHTF